MRRLTLSWIGASAVAMNRVPILIASAPSARAAASPRPAAKPPLAMIGIATRSAAAGISTSPGTSSSPRVPRALEAVDAHRCCAAALGAQRMPNARALVNHLHAGGGERRQVWGLIVACRPLDRHSGAVYRVTEFFAVDRRYGPLPLETAAQFP